jgi:hypothetical protein
MSGNSKVNMNLKITQQQKILSLFARPCSQQRFSSGWLSVKASKPTSVFQSRSYSQQRSVHILMFYQYFINLSKNTTKIKKIVFWPDLASAYYAKDTLIRIEELKIEYVPKEVNPSNVPQIRLM